MNSTIKILGKTNKQIGNQLESLIKELFSSLGFGEFIRNAYKTGAEIDIRAKHRVTGTPLICECKAKKSYINTPSLRLFFAELEKERKNEDRLVGLVVSTSGFSGTAKQWYSELDNNTKEYFSLVGPDKLLSNLIESNFTIAPNAIDVIVKQRYPMGQLHKHFLTYSEFGIVWVLIYQIDGIPSFHTFVDAFGKPIPTWKCKELQSLLKNELTKTKFFGLDLRDKIQVELFRNEGLSIGELSLIIQESETDIKISLSILIKEGRVNKIPNKEAKKDEYYLNREVVPFVNIANNFLKSSNSIIFFSSDYTLDMLNSNELSSFIDSRYQLDMKEKEKISLMHLLMLSPSALWYALFGDTKRSIRTKQEIKNKNFKPEKKSQLSQMHRTSLLQTSIPHAIKDLLSDEFSLSNHMAKLGIRRCRLKSGIDAIGTGWKTLTSYSEIALAFEKVGQDILEAGSIVTSTKPAEAIMWDGLLYLEVNELNVALEEFNKALKEYEKDPSDEKLHQAIHINIASVYIKLEKWKLALEALEQASCSVKIEFPELLSKKLACLLNLKQYENAKKIKDELISHFPEFDIDKFLSENNLTLL